ncbi:hypothetical protein IWX50DRAFT_462745 [Phyllosticta citricarpa]
MNPTRRPPVSILPASTLKAAGSRCEPPELPSTNRMQREDKSITTTMTTHYTLLALGPSRVARHQCLTTSVPKGGDRAMKKSILRRVPSALPGLTTSDCCPQNFSMAEYARNYDTRVPPLLPILQTCPFFLATRAVGVHPRLDAVRNSTQPSLV